MRESDLHNSLTAVLVSLLDRRIEIADRRLEVQDSANVNCKPLDLRTA